MEKNQRHNRSQKSADNFNQPSTREDNTKSTDAENQTAIYGKHHSLTIGQRKQGRNVLHSNIQEIEFTDEEIID